MLKADVRRMKFLYWDVRGKRNKEILSISEIISGPSMI